MATPVAGGQSQEEVERVRDERNAMLVVSGLFFAATYTAVLQPPGGTNDNGASNLALYQFLLFAIFNTLGYSASLYSILELIENVRMMPSFFNISLGGITATYTVALVNISPPSAKKWTWVIPSGTLVALYGYYKYVKGIKPLGSVLQPSV